MNRLTVISGAGVRGPACFLVETANRRFMLDLGYGPEPGRWSDVSGVGKVDALLLSHSHADHAGALKFLGDIGTPPTHATEVVLGIVSGAAATHALPLNGESEVLGIRVRTGRNGHAPGGVWLHLDIGGGLLYTGDYSVESPVYAFDPPPPAGTVVLDASYGDYDAPLAERVAEYERVFDAGPVLLPVPPAGRGPEMALHAARSGRWSVRLDDPMREALRRLAGPAAASLKPGIAAELARLADSAAGIDAPGGVMLSANADGTGGMTQRLVGRWSGDAQPAIVFSGYLPPRTPAETLTQSGRARFVRWNVHPRISDNAALVRAIGARTVLPAFGPHQHGDAWRKAFAPARVVLDGPVEL